MLRRRRNLCRGSSRKKGYCSTSCLQTDTCSTPHAKSFSVLFCQRLALESLAPGLLLSFPHGFIFLQAFMQNILWQVSAKPRGSSKKAFDSLTGLLAAFQYRLLLERSA